MQTAIVIYLIIQAAFYKACMDVLQFRYDVSRFKDNEWFDPRFSWKNKWKNGNRSEGEAFPLSSTVLVFLTDGWHLFQFGFLTSMFLGVVFYKPMFHWAIDFIILKSIFTGTFELMFSKVLIKKA